MLILKTMITRYGPQGTKINFKSSAFLAGFRKWMMKSFKVMPFRGEKKMRVKCSSGYSEDKDVYNLIQIDMKSLFEYLWNCINLNNGNYNNYDNINNDMDENKQ